MGRIDAVPNDVEIAEVVCAVAGCAEFNSREHMDACFGAVFQSVGNAQDAVMVGHSKDLNAEGEGLGNQLFWRVGAVRANAVGPASLPDMAGVNCRVGLPWHSLPVVAVQFPDGLL